LFSYLKAGFDINHIKTNISTIVGLTSKCVTVAVVNCTLHAVKFELANQNVTKSCQAFTGDAITFWSMFTFSIAVVFVTLSNLLRSF